ncbi:MAG TPA: AraC family transcriptional regulator [Thermoanaerobaculia bacterium]
MFDDFRIHVYRSGEVLPVHSHPDSHLIVVLSGGFLDVSGGTERLCASSTVLLRAAGEAHEDHFRAPISKYLTVPLTGQSFATIATTAPAAARIAAAVERKKAERTRVAALLERIVRDTTIAQRARAMIAERCSGPLQVGAIAAELGVNAVRLTRAIRTSSGRTPSQLRTEARVLLACDELRRSRSSLAEVAAKCGFFDQSHMTNVFRRTLGMTPLQYVRFNRENPSKT